MFFGWFKRSLNQSIGSFSTNPHFALFRPDRRSDIFGNVSNHWGMVTYTFFWNNFFGSLIRAHTGSFANVCAGTSSLYIKVGQILGLSENGSWVLVDAHRFLGGLSLHLNHLIAEQVSAPYWQFGTLPIGIFFSNLVSGQLETSLMTSYCHFWNLSTFGDSRAVWVFWPKLGVFRKSKFSWWRSDGASMWLGGFR